MTYNLRVDVPGRPNGWLERRERVARVIREIAPDLLGTQEGLYHQTRDLAADLSGHDWIGLGRDGGSRGEFMAVFFARVRLEPVAFDHFWLSPTPEQPSVGWGNSLRRMATWVRLRDRRSGREVVVINTHFDHESAPARLASARLLRERAGAFDPEVPFVVLGDFNEADDATGAAHEELTRGAGLVNVWKLAIERTNAEVDTFNAFGPPAAGGTRIDWILVRGATAVPRVQVVLPAEPGPPPSDHYPVVAEVRW